jgi:predicted kinase
MSARAQRFLLQLAGPPGVGKSTLARAIAEHKGGVALDRDVLKSRLIDSGVSIEDAGRLSFDLMYGVAADVLDQGRHVVLDTTSHYPDIPERSALLAADAGARFRFIECTLQDTQELKRRLTTRPRRSSQMGQFDVTPRGSTAEKVGVHRWKTYGPSDGWLVLDLAAPLEDYLRVALNYLD